MKSPGPMTQSGFVFAWRQVFLLWLSGLIAATLGSAQAQSSRAELTLKDFIRQVLEYNESVQVRMLELEITRKRLNAEKGIFEPELVASIERVDSERPNTIEQRRSLQIGVFDEKNLLYNAGVELLGPTGARLRLGYNLRDLRNNLPETPFFLGATNVGTHEYFSFAGATLVQPLLKNRGSAATLANIRLAAGASELAFQEYRRQLMLVISRAEAAYWDLYFIQEQHRISQESVRVADAILGDNRSRFQVGKSSELEILQAEAGLATRRLRESEAEQRLYEAINRLTTFYSASVLEAPMRVRAIDEPPLQDIQLSYYESWQEAFDLNPDYLAQRRQNVLENVRLAYAKNQRLPQLDLRASYGLNGLGDTPASSFDEVERGEFHAWSVALELRLPLGGGIRGRNELSAAKLRQRQALLGLKEIEVQLANGLDTALRKVRNSRTNVFNYEKVVEFNETLLQSQLDGLKVGKTDSRTVLETEEDLFEAKNAVLESLVQHQRALLEFELVKGTLLRSRDLELTKEQLVAQTLDRLPERWQRLELYQSYRRAVQQRYGGRRGLTDEERDEALRMLRRRMDELEKKSLEERP